MTPATAVGYIEMRIAKVVGLAADDELFDYVVLDEAGDRHLAIEIGQPEAFSLAARLGGITWPRPMTYQFVAALVHALGGRIRQVRIDQVVEEAYVATVEVDGPPGVQAVDARPSDALTSRYWSRRRSSSLLRCCTRRRPDARVMPPRRRGCVGRWQLHR